MLLGLRHRLLRLRELPQRLLILSGHCVCGLPLLNISMRHTPNTFNFKCLLTTKPFKTTSSQSASSHTPSSTQTTSSSPSQTTSRTSRPPTHTTSPSDSSRSGRPPNTPPAATPPPNSSAHSSDSSTPEPVSPSRPSPRPQKKLSPISQIKLTLASTSSRSSSRSSKDSSMKRSPKPKHKPKLPCSPSSTSLRTAPFNRHPTVTISTLLSFKNPTS